MALLNLLHRSRYGVTGVQSGPAGPREDFGFGSGEICEIPDVAKKTTINKKKKKKCIITINTQLEIAAYRIVSVVCTSLWMHKASVS